MGIDIYSLTALPLTMRCRGNHISNATGFFRKSESGLFLVSNWHVFSGRNALSGQPLHNSGAIPDQLSVPIPIKGRVGHYMLADINLIDSEGNPIWLQHRMGQKVDVAALRILSLPENCEVFDIRQPDENYNMGAFVGMDIFILGFPKNIALQTPIPIWKRGSIASEPDLSVNNLPLILLDTATREGMSGAPVFLRSYGTALTLKGVAMMGAGVYTRFLGIYSGRYGAEDLLAAQLGRLWKASAIDEVLAEGRLGSFVLA